VACLLASLANPYGIQLHVHIYRYLLDPFYQRYISEFQPLNFQETAARFLEVLIFFGVVATVRSLNRRDFVHPLIFVVWLHLALTSARHSPIFVILITPWVCRELSDLVIQLQGAQLSSKISTALKNFSTGAAEFSQSDRVERFYLTSLVAVLFVAAALYSPTPSPNFRAGFNPKHFPAEAVTKLSTAAGMGRVFSTDLWGGYLIYRQYPSLKVFIDGRSDFYGPAFVKEYLDILNAQPGWDRRLDGYGVYQILIPTYTPLSAVLMESKRWRIVVNDGVAILFVKGA
jgi:hypothetical protein